MVTDMNISLLAQYLGSLLLKAKKITAAEAVVRLKVSKLLNVFVLSVM